MFGRKISDDSLIVIEPPTQAGAFRNIFSENSMKKTCRLSDSNLVGTTEAGVKHVTGPSFFHRNMIQLHQHSTKQP